MRFRFAPAAAYIILLLTALIISYGRSIQTKPVEPQTAVTLLAKEYLGAPYLYGGATPAGFDCSGYIMFLFQRCGKDLPRSADKQATIGIPVNISKLQPGDLVFFSAKTGCSAISHVGLYIGNRKFIHASYTAKKIIISNLDEPYWQSVIHTARRIPP